MTDVLLPYYNRELAFFRRMAAEFAAANPKIAARLRLGAEASEDPHVERMIEAFAYLNARIRHKLEDDFPEISDAFLGALYPHYLAPIPSMAIVQFLLDPSQTGLTSGYLLPKGTPLETETIEGEPCRFRTAYPVRLWPIRLQTASLSGRPIAAPSTADSAGAAAVLKLRLESFAEDTTFDQLEIASLRFFLKGPPQYTLPLYELLLNNTIEVALASSPSDTDPVLLGSESIQPVGFEADQGMLPYPSRSPLAYRLLTEFFTFPTKFLFFDIAGLDTGVLQRFGSVLEIYVYLENSSVDLEQNVSLDTLRLGCTPVVNLFRQRAEPIQLTHAQTQYHLVPDSRRLLANEVFSIDRVVASSPEGDEIEYRPFFSVQHAFRPGEEKAFWCATRRPAEAGEGKTDSGTEVDLSFVNLDLDPAVESDWYVGVETTCLNRDLPSRLPFGGGEPKLFLSEGQGPLAGIECLTAPTPTLRPPRRQGGIWRLISHLTLGHLSLVDGEQGGAALREILRLYDFRDSAETRSVIESLLAVSSRRVVARAAGGVCRGTEVQLQFRPEQFAENGIFLFACVLERFFGLYCSINSFSRLVITVKGREGHLRRWLPRAGEKVLL
jgi:type VI secretion system protein ImpG